MADGRSKTRRTPPEAPDDQLDISEAHDADDAQPAAHDDTDDVQDSSTDKSQGVKVKYLGHASIRSFVEEDFTRHGIEGQGDVEFNHDNKWMAWVSPEAAGFLVGTREFEKV